MAESQSRRISRESLTDKDITQIALEETSAGLSDEGTVQLAALIADDKQED